LVELQIRNFAIIDELSVSFNPGLTVITGETGAGKSILVNAVNLLLGSRGSADLIRSGTQEAMVAALFSFTHEAPEILAKFKGPEVLVKRKLSTTGRNRVYINGQMATVGMLTDLCRGLVSVSGQHEHQLFLEPEAHLEIIDRFGGVEKKRKAYEQTFAELKRVKGELRRLRRQALERREKEELHRFQLEEIDSGRIQMDEEVQLGEERERLRHVDSLQHGASTAHQLLYSESGAVLEEVFQCQKILADLSRLDDTLKPVAATLEGIGHQVEDVSLILRDYSQRIQADPARLEWVEDRLHTIRGLMRKYGGSTRAVLEHADRLRQELEATENGEVEMGAKEEALESIGQQALSEALELSKDRRKTANRFSRAVEKSLVSLDMPHCRFEVRFDLEEGSAPGGTFGTYGASTNSVRIDDYFLDERGVDRVAFFFSANPGEEVRPMGKIASGGELSRIVLALKELMARESVHETLIFDEVDAGIGGRTADRVGQRLRALSRKHQVVCITHLPQIACYGKYHFVVRKSTRRSRTITVMKELDEQARVDEIARMLGGARISAKTRAHASEMLTQAQQSGARVQGS
jgi:DNA repair protein RecN (Recombination protein N)